MLQAAAKAETAAVEGEFREYRAAQRSTPEADLARQLADAQEQARRAEAKAQKAQAAKHSYKDQVHLVRAQPIFCRSHCMLSPPTSMR